jgi:uncharacterized repeat protein (TIGR03847 family)
MRIDLDPVERITTDSIGPPGKRIFYLQGRKGEQLVTLLVEKEQVELLAASVVSILAQVGKEVGEGQSEGSMELEDPLLPEWQAGRLSIGYEEDRDLFVLEVEEQLEEEEEDEEEERDAGVVRFWATGEQMLALARHGAAVVSRGRPRCGLCGNPIDPEGHVCPALNGHRQRTD